MSIKPDLFNKTYHLSDIKQGAIYENGKRVFRGYGSDTTDRTDNVIYIGSPPLQRMVAFKAFLESFKLDLTKEVEIKEEVDKQTHIYTEYQSDMNFSVTLNIPAHSVNESRNNLAKVEELQRLIAPLGKKESVNEFYGTKNNYFSVWFKNLIHSGRKYDSYPSPSSITFDDLMTYGFFCHIETINYEPDMEAGFFDYDDVTDRRRGSFLFPRNIKLSLTLKYGIEFTGKRKQALMNLEGNIARPLYAFHKNGHYVAGDNGGFPFGIRVGTKGHAEQLLGDFELDTTNMNKLDYSMNGSRPENKGSFLFISMDIKNDSLPNSFANESRRKRWVRFKGFIDSLNREHSVNNPVITEDKSRILGNPLDFDKETTFKNLEYGMKITVPSANLAEAKNNCGKIQYLMRLFFKKENDENSPTDSLRHSLKVYSPSFIESPNTTTYYATDFNTMYDNSLDLFMTDLGIDIDLEAGFFAEGGKLWPKVFTLDFKLKYMSGDLIKNYAIEKGQYKMLPSQNSDYKGKEHLFPFPRQTSKIKIGG